METAVSNEVWHLIIHAQFTKQNPAHIKSCFCQSTDTCPCNVQLLSPIWQVNNWHYTHFNDSSFSNVDILFFALWSALLTSRAMLVIFMYVFRKPGFPDWTQYTSSHLAHIHATWYMWGDNGRVSNPGELRIYTYKTAQQYYKICLFNIHCCVIIHVLQLFFCMDKYCCLQVCCYKSSKGFWLYRELTCYWQHT